jgi:hypothetical protein
MGMAVENPEVQGEEEKNEGDESHVGPDFQIGGLNFGGDLAEQGDIHGFGKDERI